MFLAVLEFVYMDKIFSLSLCFLLTAGGCAWLKSDNKGPSEATQYLQTVKVVDKERLSKGGKLLLVAFQPGSDVVADDEFDKITFMILKGIADELKTAKAPFELLSAAQADDAELILEGWIKSTGKTSLARKMMFRKEKAELVIDGKIVDRNDGKTILVFTNAREAKNKTDEPKQLGLIMGYDLGQFIVNELKNK